MANDEYGPREVALGDLIEEFKPMMGNIIAGFVISVLLVAAGAAAIGFPLHAAYLADWDLPVDVKKGWSWLAVVLFCLLGIGMTIGSVFGRIAGREAAAHVSHSR